MGNGKNLGTRRELQPLVTHARGRTRADVTRVQVRPVSGPRAERRSPGAAQRPGVDRHRAGESHLSPLPTSRVASTTTSTGSSLGAPSPRSLTLSPRTASSLSMTGARGHVGGIQESAVCLQHRDHPGTTGAGTGITISAHRLMQCSKPAKGACTHACSQPPSGVPSPSTSGQRRRTLAQMLGTALG